MLVPKGRAITQQQHLEDLEAEMVRRLYLLRSCEQVLQSYPAHSEAPLELREAYTDARMSLSQSEIILRKYRYGY